MTRAAAILAMLLPAATLAQTFQPVPSMPVSSFLDSLGVNAHNEYTDGDYRLSGDTLRQLQYLGIHNVRDGVPNPETWFPAGQGLAAMTYLMANGIHFDLQVNCNTALSVYMQQLDTLAQQYPGSITAVEGTNEINNQPCLTGAGTSEANALSYQAALYSEVHSDPSLAGVPVYDFTGGSTENSIAGRADYTNDHPYSNLSRGTTVYARMVSDFAAAYSLSASAPRVITEDGFYTTPDGGDGVDETSQAVGELQIYFSGAALGITRTYVYELKDAYLPGTPPFSTWGFFHDTTAAPKQSATVMHHLTTVLGWLPQSTTVVPVTASVSGATPDAHEVALTDGFGGVALFVWRDIPVWSVQAQASAIPAPVPVTIKLPRSCVSAYTYDTYKNVLTPVSAGSGPITIGVEPYPVGFYCSMSPTL